MLALVEGAWHYAVKGLNYVSLQSRILMGFVFVEAALVAFILVTQYLDGPGNPSFNRYETVALEARLAEHVAMELQAIVRSTEQYVATGEQDHLDRSKVLTSTLDSHLLEAANSATSAIVAEKIDALKVTLSTFAERFDRLAELRGRYSTILAHDLQPLIGTVSAELTLLSARVWNREARDAAVEIGHANESLLWIERRMTVFVDRPDENAANATRSAARDLQRYLADLSAVNDDGEIAEQIDRIIRYALDLEATFNDLASSALAYQDVTQQFLKENLATAEERAQALADYASIALVDLGQATRDEFDDAENKQLLYAIGALVVSLAFACLVGGEISYRIKRMAATMDRLARGDLDIETDKLDRRHELGDMARSVRVFKENALRIDRMNRELQHRTNQLEVALETEQKANAQQRRFVSMVSHEFRTPLAIIDSIASRLEKKGDQLDAVQRSPRLQRIRDAVTRLINLIESTLSSASLEAGTITFRSAPLDLRALVKKACANQQEISDQHEIIVDLESLPSQFTGDAELLQQAITNLLSNAVKYSPDSKLVNVSGSVVDGHAVIAVRDHGIGIPEEDLPKLFTQFFRADTAARIAGTGIGLHLVKSFIEMHKGQVEATSIEGQGSTFTVRLPLDLPLSLAEEAA
ncbi:MAG: ATP-binding protein [Geminicoccaceae bacterium]